MKAGQGRQQAERIAATPAEGAGKAVGAARDLDIKPHPADATEVAPSSRPVWRGRPARVRRNNRHYDAQINLPHAAAAGNELPPRRQRIVHCAQLQRPGKIIAAAMRDHQHWKPQPDQLRQMTVHRAVAAENQNGIRFMGVRRHAQVPYGVRAARKRLQMPG